MFHRLARLIAHDTGQACVTLTPATRFLVDARTRITRAHDDGRVVMHLDAGRVWAINGVGSQIWQLLADGQSLQAIVD
ncbi:MAG: PqqD family protein, partial [Vicinamibacterales bacterium]